MAAWNPLAGSYDMTGADPHHAPPTADPWTRAKGERNWLVFELRNRANSSKLDKVPVDPETGRQVSFHEAAKLTFDEAQSKVRSHNGQRGAQSRAPSPWGIGYHPAANSALVGVDMDDAFESDGSPKPHIKERLIYRFGFADFGTIRV